MQYMMVEARRHDLTQDRTCQGKELSFAADTFSCYLESSREFNRLQSQYGSREKSVEEAAKTVGLNLPKKH